MKKTIITTFAIMTGIVFAFAQNTINQNYQGVLRNDDGTPVANSTINIELAFEESAVGGLIAYSESHSVITNEFGEFNVVLGDGTAIVGTPYEVRFSEEIYYLHVTINGTDMGTTRIRETNIWDRVPFGGAETNMDVEINGEVNSEATGSAHLLPIAYGSISTSGVIEASSGNIGINKISTGVYEVTISGENFDYTNYIVSISNVDADADESISYTNTSSGNLRVSVSNRDSGNPQDSAFSFIVFKP